MNQKLTEIMEEKWRIKNFRIFGLFGTFNHNINFNLEEKITIIHGPNGYGKTTILRILNAIFDKNFHILNTINFNKIKIVFDNSCNLEIHKKKEERKITKGKEKEENRITRSIKDNILKFMFFNEKGKKIIDDKYSSYKNSVENIPYSILRRAVLRSPKYERISTSICLDLETNERIPISRIINNRIDELLPYLPLNSREELKFSAVKEELIDILDKVDIEFIDTERLKARILIENEGLPTRSYRDDNFYSELQLSVNIFSNLLREKINEKLAISNEISQKLDRTFPSRLIKLLTKKELAKIDSKKIIEGLNKLEEKRKALANVGLHDLGEETVQPSQDLDTHTLHVLSLYLSDNQEKLAVYDELADKIELLLDIINTHFLNKKLKAKKGKGFVVETNNELNQEIRLNELSSGEQHEIVLQYKMLFGRKPRTLILIDEPEISLHVAWQLEYLKNLRKIIDKTDFDVIIATHSPQIINDRWDLTEELTGDFIE